MTIKGAIVATLTGDSRVTALLSKPNAVYFRAAPSGASTPYLIFHRQSEVRQESFAVQHFIAEEVWMVKAVHRGSSGKVTDELDALIDELLTEPEWTLDNRRLLYSRKEAAIDLGEEDKGELIHNLGGLYRIATEPTSE